MKSFESPMERMLMYEMYNEKVKKYTEKNYTYNDSYIAKIVNYGMKIKKRSLKK